MRTIGILGGMSWESTLLYYRWLNEGVRQRLGGLHSARIVMHSVDFQPVEAAMQRGDWDNVQAQLTAAALSVRNAGADFLLIATNTMHKLADAISRDAELPVLHIADATAAHVISRGHSTVGLLGTAFTMEQPFYRDRLRDLFGLTVLTPSPEDRTLIHDVIFQELCNGVILPESRAAYLRIVRDLAQRGAQAVIMGCTEICLLLENADSPVPLLDTTRLHVEAALDNALADHAEQN